MSRSVLDASALLVLLNDEPGADKVADLLPEALISSVNLSEVVAKLAEEGMPEASIRQALDGLALETVPFDREQAYSAGLLRPTTRSLGLSLGDRACLGLARQIGLPAVTTDGVWHEVDIGVMVELIR